MAVVRADVATSPHAATFVEGVVALSQRSTRVTPTQLNRTLPLEAAGARIVGTAAEMERPLSWWDLLCWWHVRAMTTPAGTGNKAHRGPIFLPWHRMFLRRLEEAIQAVTGDPTFGLPYWDWSADGQLDAVDQTGGPVWSVVGPPSGQIIDGTVGQLRVRLYEDAGDQRLYVMAPRPIWRQARRGTRLPDRTDESRSLADGLYDGPGWDEQSDSFRNKVEGFQDPTEPPRSRRRPGPWMHNRVHVWVGGEMAPGSSPNDPVFWLNHCNVDRLWEAWMGRHGRTYLPAADEGPEGQRADEPMLAVAWPALRPDEVLDPTGSGRDWYRYDRLPT
ncbi:MAG TPA: tyrosinase family protein [Acidimicrobiales bacterium]